MIRIGDAKILHSSRLSKKSAVRRATIKESENGHTLRLQ